jgi:hypothetical protein
MASTSGIVIATTRPGPDVEPQRPEVQAQADEADRQHDDHRLDQHTHEFTDRRDTACGWSWICSSSMPTGSSGLDRLHARPEAALAQAMMSPPLAIDTPSAMTCRPWWRTITDGGST